MGVCLSIGQGSPGPLLATPNVGWTLETLPSSIHQLHYQLPESEMLFRAHQPMPIDQCLWFSCRYAPKRGRPFSAFIGRRHESGLRVPPSLSSLCPTWGDSPRHLGLARGRGSKSFGDPLASSLKDAVGGHRRKCRSTPMKICFYPHPPHSLSPGIPRLQDSSVYPFFGDPAKP